MNKRHLGRDRSFNWGGQRAITEKVTYEQRPEGAERRSHADTREIAFCRGKSQCKGSEQGMPGCWKQG